MYFSEKPTIVSTVLGSCVSVTMFNRSFRIGAICHALLPQCKNNGSCNSNCHDKFKYIDCSIQKIIKKFDSLKIKHREIETKLFGGSDMIETKEGRHIRLTVGKQNIKVAMQIIEREHLNLISYDTGGFSGRKIFFNTCTGEILLKRLKRNNIVELK